MLVVECKIKIEHSLGSNLQTLRCVFHKLSVRKISGTKVFSEVISTVSGNVIFIDISTEIQPWRYVQFEPCRRLQSELRTVLYVIVCTGNRVVIAVKKVIRELEII